jgi:uncharacterized UBP type Zn finger protein
MHTSCKLCLFQYGLRLSSIPILQFQHAVQERMEDPIKIKQEYMLLAIISHKGDTPNCGRYSY